MLPAATLHRRLCGLHAAACLQQAPIKAPPTHIVCPVHQRFVAGALVAQVCASQAGVVLLTCLVQVVNGAAPRARAPLAAPVTIHAGFQTLLQGRRVCVSQVPSRLDGLHAKQASKQVGSSCRCLPAELGSEDGRPPGCGTRVGSGHLNCVLEHFPAALEAVGLGVGAPRQRGEDVLLARVGGRCRCGRRGR